SSYVNATIRPLALIRQHSRRRHEPESDVYRARLATYKAASVELSETRSIIHPQPIDLGRREFCGDCSHAPVNVVAAMTCGIFLQLQDNVVFPLLGKNGRIDRPTRARPVARREGREIAAALAAVERRAQAGGGWRADRR